MTIRFRSSSNCSHRHVSGMGMSVKFRFSCGLALRVCPRCYRHIGGAAPAVRQNEHELQAARHAGLPKDLQRLSLEWVMRTGDGYPFGEVLRVGSVWWFPWTTSTTNGWCSSSSIG